MSINFYHRIEGEKCPCCKRQDIEFNHIGKSSKGWAFNFQATEEIKSYAKWLEVLSASGTIEDEYGRTYTLEAFKQFIENMKKGKTVVYKDHGQFLDEEGNHFSPGDFC